MGKITILVNKAMQKKVFNEKYINRLGKQGDVFIYDKDDFVDSGYVIDFVKESEVIITSWCTPSLSKEILNMCPDLKAVLHAAGSVKPILSDELLRRKIRMTSSAIALGEGVAETALAFAISACKGFYSLGKDTAKGLWGENKAIVKDFYDITVGVISGGFVGSHMVKLLKNFHVDILMYDPTLSEEYIENLGAKKVELEKLLCDSDVISIHAPSIPATDNMLNKDNLCLIKDGAVLINTARGTVINEIDLIEELKKGRFFACIDVTNPEPPDVNNELRYMENVIMTPHIAGAVNNGCKRIALHICEEMERLNNGEKMKTEINPEDLSKLA